MRPRGVVVDTLRFDHRAVLGKGVEDLAIQQLVTEFRLEALALAVLKWCRLALHSPAKSMQNGFVGSFKGSFRGEGHSAMLFSSLAEARSQIIARKEGYNRKRPYSSRGNLTPSEFAMRMALQNQVA